VAVEPAVDVLVSLGGRGDLTGQIYRQLRTMILDGRLIGGQRLPPSRELAAQLQVSRNTVVAAYDLLSAEGYVVGRAGSGTSVAPSVSMPVAAPETSADDGPQPRAPWRSLRVAAAVSAESARYDFRAGMPDPRLFPYQSWRRLVAEELRLSSVGSGGYGEPAGDPGLRTAIAHHVGAARAIAVSADQIIVTNGLQQALDLIGRVLLSPGDVVVVEDPGYRPPRTVFRMLQARVIAVPVDAEGLRIDAIPEAARLVYVTPSHQFPLGMAMSLRRRVDLLAWARRHDAVIVEDDYDSEFRYAGRPIEPLRALDSHDRVVYAGSFSKVMSPTLRLGFCIAPRSLFEAIRGAKFLTDWHTALPMQKALAKFINSGTLARHVRRLRPIYQQRHDLITHLIDRDLHRWLELIPSPAGLHVTATLRSQSAEAAGAVAARARRLDVDVDTLESEVVEANLGGLIFGYGLISADDVPAGLARVRSALRGEDRRPS
jgi:GntR family transcriptional regulator / MocR family aminotransferase